MFVHTFPLACGEKESNEILQTETERQEGN